METCHKRFGKEHGLFFRDWCFAFSLLTLQHEFIALLIIPLLTAIVILLARRPQQVKWVALIGASLQLVAALVLFFGYRQAHKPIRRQFFLNSSTTGSPPGTSVFILGVDGISVAMILLTAFVVIAGVLVSWNMNKMTKRFFFLLILLSLGAYGFFISLDLFILFFFLEIAVIPKYLLIGIWGSGKKEYSCQ